MLELFARFEATSFSILFRESGIAFFSTLTAHSLSMAAVVGINIAVCLAVLGVTPALVLSSMRGLARLYWYAIGVIFLSGALLLVAYPAKALTNPVFYLKLCCLLSAGFIGHYLQTHLPEDRTTVSAASLSRLKVLAVTALCLWAITITAGRFLAYTYSVLLASRFY